MTIGSTVDPVVVPLGPRGPHCAGPTGCGVARGLRVHHDRLLRVEDDPDELVDLLETAVTWQELDYGDAALVPPEAWTDFAQDHPWRHPERMLRLFSLAADIALRAPAPAADPLARPGVPASRRYLVAADLLAGEL